MADAIRLATIATHEAGHAVIAMFLHVRTRYVTIVPKDDAHGHMLNHVVQFGRHGLFDDSPKGIDRTERHIIVAWAGQIAQRKFAPRSQWRIGGSADNKIAMDLFGHILHPDQKARNLQVNLLWRRTECLVEQHWQEIRAVANALLERNTLTSDEVADVVDEAMGVSGNSAHLRDLAKRLKGAKVPGMSQVRRSPNDKG